MSLSPSVSNTVGIYVCPCFRSVWVLGCLEYKIAAIYDIAMGGDKWALLSPNGKNKAAIEIKYSIYTLRRFIYGFVVIY